GRLAFLQASQTIRCTVGPVVFPITRAERCCERPPVPSSPPHPRRGGPSGTRSTGRTYPCQGADRAAGTCCRQTDRCSFPIRCTDRPYGDRAHSGRAPAVKLPEPGQRLSLRCLLCSFKVLGVDLAIAAKPPSFVRVHSGVVRPHFVTCCSCVIRAFLRHGQQPFPWVPVRCIRIGAIRRTCNHRLAFHLLLLHHRSRELPHALGTWCDKLRVLVLFSSRAEHLAHTLADDHVPPVGSRLFSLDHFRAGHKLLGLGLAAYPARGQILITGIRA